MVRGRPIDDGPHPVADPGPVPPADEPFLQAHQPVAPRGLDRRRHVVHEGMRRGPFFVRIGEHADVIERVVVHERAELVDILVGLAREARR